MPLAIGRPMYPWREVCTSACQSSRSSGDGSVTTELAVGVASRPLPGDRRRIDLVKHDPSPDDEAETREPRRDRDHMWPFRAASEVVAVGLICTAVGGGPVPNVRISNGHAGAASATAVYVHGGPENRPVAVFGDVPDDTGFSYPAGTITTLQPIIGSAAATHLPPGMRLPPLLGD
jgi:hypothetical protein